MFPSKRNLMQHFLETGKKRAVGESHLISNRRSNGFCCACAPVFDSQVVCWGIMRRQTTLTDAKLCKKFACLCCHVSKTNSYSNHLS